MTISVYQRAPGGHIERASEPEQAMQRPSTIWIDLVSPSQDEENRVEALFEVDAPTQADRKALEESSRFYADKKALVLSPTIVTRVKPTTEKLKKREQVVHVREVISFILKGDVLITVRDCELKAFEVDAGRASARISGAKTPQDVLMALLEGVIERAADFLSDLG